MPVIPPEPSIRTTGAPRLPALVRHQHEALEQACYAVQDGAKLVTRLLRANTFTAAHLLAQAHATLDLLTMLRVCG